MFQQVNEATDDHNGEDHLHLGAGGEFLEHLVLDRIEHGVEGIVIGDNQRAAQDADDQRKNNVAAVDGDDDRQEGRDDR